MSGNDTVPGERVPMPSLWAAAVALLGLLAFGVFVGSILNGPPQSASRVLLAASSHGAPARTRATTAGKTPETPGGASSLSEAGTETSSEPEASSATTTSSEQPSGKQGESSAPASSGGEHPASNGGPAPSSEPSTGGPELPAVQHVFLIVLSDEGESAAFGARAGDAYLSKTLRQQGELVEGYYAVSGGELANEIALISGQGPTPQTVEDCPLYTNLAPGSPGKLGQAMGSGCVYPSTTLTLADQLTNAGKTWRAYVEGLGSEGAAGVSQTCLHPALGSADSTQGGTSGGYVTWRNPFVYFHSLIDEKACTENDVGLEKLAPDLKAAIRTPSFAYIAPNRCHDGSPQPCAPGQPAGLQAAGGFLRKTVGEIEGSPGYKQGGLIAITFDQAPQSGAQADSSGCCLSSAFPNLPSGGLSTASSPSTATTPPTASPTPAGGGKVGLLLISKYVKPGSFNATGEYNHFSLLRSIENLFDLQALGYASEPSLLAFDKSVFNAHK